MKARIVCLAVATVALSAALHAAEPATVVITLHPKAGGEQELADVIARHYALARRLDLLQPEAVHVTLRGADESDRPYFVEILTWRDASVPDNAPKDIVSVWTEMNRLVEPRAGRPGLDIVPMRAVTREK
ncbi:MAG TPA: hypothetical protein VKH42_15755 [Vicinamibacterales bacterium]|nr:hypothetical protein [Vicinamibacterales bacterium]